MGNSGIFDRVHYNPYLHFMISEFWGAVAGAFVWTCFYFLSVFTHFVRNIVSIPNEELIAFFYLILNWGSAIGASATFIIITASQIHLLVVRLREVRR